MAKFSANGTSMHRAGTFPSTEIEALLILNRLSQGKPKLANCLLGYETCLAVFDQYNVTRNSSRNSSRNPLPNADKKLPPYLLSLLQKGFSSALRKAVDSDLVWLEAVDHTLVSIYDEKFPALLKQIYDPPLVLYLAGDATLLAKDQIAIVGSRAPTQVGLKIAREFAQTLSELGLVITSGMAFGIDAMAHAGALAHNGKTIAVWGTGCDRLYPRRHERLAMSILEQGLIVSEFPLGSNAYPAHFPQRNRIVTGMSMGTLVVEAALKSGSLISARLAMEQGREVYAIPGSIYNPQSAGCLQLIKDGAILTRSIEDIIAELPHKQLELIPDPWLNLSTQERDLIKHINDAPCSADRLHELTAIPIPELISLLTKLEIEGLIIEESLGYVVASLAGETCS